MNDESTVHAVLGDGLLTLDELCRHAGVGPEWLHERLTQGLLPGVPAGAARVDVAVLRRVRCMVWLEQDFDAVPELAALVADLQDELDRLRARLRRAGLE